MWGWIQASGHRLGKGLGRYIVSELLWRVKDGADFAAVSGQCSNPANPEKLYRMCSFDGSDIAQHDKKQSETNTMKRVVSFGMPMCQPIGSGSCENAFILFKAGVTVKMPNRLYPAILDRCQDSLQIF